MSPWRIVDRAHRDQLGEGTLWSVRERALYWVDILAPALNRLVLATGEVSRWPMPEPIGWVVERAGGGFIAGFKSGIAELELDPVRIRHIVDPEPGQPGNRLNDGKADSAGAIWFGSMDMAEQEDSGSLYRVGADRAVTAMDSGYRVPNGPAFSRDGRWLYHSDTAWRTVFRFPRLGTARLGPRETFITFAAGQGHPDGMTVDSEDHLWIAHWGVARVSRFRPDGTLSRAILLPARQITNVAFCGEQFDRLFVSSAATGLPQSDYDGALFEIDADATGLPPGLFAG